MEQVRIAVIDWTIGSELVRDARNRHGKWPERKAQQQEGEHKGTPYPWCRTHLVLKLFPIFTAVVGELNQVVTENPNGLLVASKHDRSEIRSGVAIDDRPVITPVVGFDYESAGSNRPAGLPVGGERDRAEVRNGTALAIHPVVTCVLRLDYGAAGSDRPAGLPVGSERDRPEVRNGTALAIHPVVTCVLRLDYGAAGSDRPAGLPVGSERDRPEIRNGTALAIHPVITCVPPLPVDYGAPRSHTPTNRYVTGTRKRVKLDGYTDVLIDSASVIQPPRDHLIVSSWSETNLP